MPGSEQYCSSDDLRAPLRLRLRSASTRPSNPYLSGLVPGAASAAMLRPPAFRSRLRLRFRPVPADPVAEQAWPCGPICSPPSGLAARPLSAAVRGWMGPCWACNWFGVVCSAPPPSPLRRGRMRPSGPTLTRPLSPGLWPHCRPVPDAWALMGCAGRLWPHRPCLAALALLSAFPALFPALGPALLF